MKSRWGFCILPTLLSTNIWNINTNAWSHLQSCKRNLPRCRFPRILVTTVHEVCGNCGILGDFGSISPVKGESSHIFLAFLPFPPPSSSHQTTLIYGCGCQSYKQKVHIGFRIEATYHTNIKWKKKKGGKVSIWFTFPTSSRMATLAHPDLSPFRANNWHTHTVSFWSEHWTDIIENIHGDYIILHLG